MHGEGLTNAGKKETRQFNQILDKAVKEGREGVKDVEARTPRRSTGPRGGRPSRKGGAVRVGAQGPPPPCRYPPPSGGARRRRPPTRRPTRDGGHAPAAFVSAPPARPPPRPVTV
jgi:hypothetical protein